MKVAFISPYTQSGLTTATAIVGMFLTWTQRVSSIITYTGESDVAKMLGAQAIEDKTRSISQLSKLLSERAISKDQILDYCIPLAKDLYMLDTTSATLTSSEKDSVNKFVFDQVPTDFVVCECVEGLRAPSTQAILQIADLVVMLFEPNPKQMDACKMYMSDSLWPKDKRTLMLCNKYDDIVMPLRNISASFGIKHVNMCKLHYNPWIMRLSQSGNLSDIVDSILSKDPRVVELNNDLREIMEFLMITAGTRVRWGD